MPSDESSQDEVFTETPDAPSGEENQDKPSADKLAFDTPAERFYFMVSLIEAFVLRFLIRHCERLLDDDGKPDMHGISLREVLIRTGVVQQCDKEKEWLLDHGVFPQEVLDDRLAWYQAFIKKRLEANDAQGKLDILMPERIQAEFQLSDEELLILCAVAAPQINQDIMRLYRFASGLDTTIFPGFFYAELLADETRSSGDILRKLAPDMPLQTYALIDVGMHDEWKELTPPGLAPLSVPKRVAAFLAGFDDASLLEYAKVCPPSPPERPLILDKAFQKNVAKCLKKSRARIHLIGPRGYGRRSFVRQCAAQSGIPTIEIDLSQFTGEETPNRILQMSSVWLREARLLQAWLIFRCDVPPTPEVERIMVAVAARFQKRLEHFPGTIVIISESRIPILAQWFGTCTEILCQLPSRDVQFDLWKTALRPHLCDEDAEVTAKYISTSYRLTMGEILNTIDECQAQNPFVPIQGPLLAQTLHASRGRELSGLAELKATPLSLQDIVLSKDNADVIREILNYATYSEFVSEEWGFSKISQATGLSVLFSGPPGTGKTLTAGVIAHELKRALYVVDISRIVDKYIGETEKKLARIFEHAQKSQAILLFDEADSLFAKRTNVKSSNDRYANLEVNYLLQKLEAYHGMTILTTNLADSLDEALARRIQFKVAFDMPNAGERAKLWDVLLPVQARDEDIDFQRLGEGFEMSGGHIKNATFRACIQAASLHQRVTTDMLWDAAVLEFRSMGHVIRDIFEEDVREF